MNMHFLIFLICFLLCITNIELASFNNNLNFASCILEMLSISILINSKKFKPKQIKMWTSEYCVTKYKVMAICTHDCHDNFFFFLNSWVISPCILMLWKSILMSRVSCTLDEPSSRCDVRTKSIRWWNRYPAGWRRRQFLCYWVVSSSFIALKMYKRFQNDLLFFYIHLVVNTRHLLVINIFTHTITVVVLASLLYCIICLGKQIFNYENSLDIID